MWNLFARILGWSLSAGRPIEVNSREVNEAVREIYEAALRIPEPFSSLSDDEKGRIHELMQKFEGLEPKLGNLPGVEFVRPMLLSKCGRYAEALTYAEQRYERAPNWSSAGAVANAARRAGDLERAATMFAAAAKHDPEDVTCWLEIGDIRLEQGRYAEALASYEKVLAKDNAHQWALPSAFYCRHHIGIEGQWLASLREVANQEGCTCGLEGCLTSMFGGYGSGDGIARAEYLLRKVDG